MCKTGPPPLRAPSATTGLIPAWLTCLERISGKSEIILPIEPADSFLAKTVNGRFDEMKTVMSPEFVLKVESRNRLPESNSARILPIAVDARSAPPTFRKRIAPPDDSQ